MDSHKKVGGGVLESHGNGGNSEGQEGAAGAGVTWGSPRGREKSEMGEIFMFQSSRPLQSHSCSWSWSWNHNQSWSWNHSWSQRQSCIQNHSWNQSQDPELKSEPEQ